MFNNPFDSFHNTVAEAKEEREQLDRLLTVSTPRERLLVWGIAVLLIILAAWAFFGSVARSLTVDGVLVEPGADPNQGSRSVQALVWVESDVAMDISPGMPAVIELATADGEAETLDGEVVTIAPVPLSEDLAEFESTVRMFVHRVDITLEENIDLAALSGSECRIVIQLGRQPPIALFGMRRS
ncbi:MAG: hypothetical protein OXQ29_00010 [Rhodospirillaceae bacterium]|nr:hypothetical protein [Rhodospirillaceae bacterium]